MSVPAGVDPRNAPRRSNDLLRTKALSDTSLLLKVNICGAYQWSTAATLQISDSKQKRGSKEYQQYQRLNYITSLLIIDNYREVIHDPTDRIDGKCC
jgi:hypothetical protein